MITVPDRDLRPGPLLGGGSAWHALAAVCHHPRKRPASCEFSATRAVSWLFTIEGVVPVEVLGASVTG